MPHIPAPRKSVLVASVPTDLEYAVRVLAAVERKKLCHVMEAALRRYVDDRRALLVATPLLPSKAASDQAD